MELKITETPASANIALSGRLDVLAAPDFDKKMESVVEAGHSMLFDLRELEYISSAGLRCFLALVKKTKLSGKRIALFGAQPIVSEVFTASGFDKFLPLYATQDEAQSAL